MKYKCGHELTKEEYFSLFKETILDELKQLLLCPLCITNIMKEQKADNEYIEQLQKKVKEK